MKDNVSTSLIKDFSEKKALLDNEELRGLGYVKSFFFEDLRIISPDSDADGFLAVDGDNCTKLAEFLKSYDTGIEKVENLEMSEEELIDEVGPKRYEEVKKDLLELFESSENKHVAIVLRMRKGIYTVEMSKDSIKHSKFIFRHSANPKIPFTFEDESDGTIRLLQLASIILGRAKNRVYFVDELDRR